ncbi:hypothetical protein HDU93_007037 [Gonapodya sp. JEL0774]|nr:hypothetical protein HDU93_007037 [Gonapodya sp. JEL0774]
MAPSITALSCHRIAGSTILPLRATLPLKPAGNILFTRIPQLLSCTETLPRRLAIALPQQQSLPSTLYRPFSSTSSVEVGTTNYNVPPRKSFLGAEDLRGLLVVSIDQAVAAPLCGAKLADAGARVIKVERKGDGDFARGYDRHVRGDSSYFVWLNRGKESIGMDLKDPEDLRLLDRMISKADIFIQNLAPGATSRMKVDGRGFGSKELRKRYPRLITVDMSGYGERGPLKNMKAYDMLVQGESGVISLSGTRVGISLCDIGCGLTAYAGILQALYHRERTGKGRGVEASLYHSLSEWTNPQLLMYTEGGFASKPSGIHHPGLAPYGAYPTGDGLEVLISIQNEREWANLATKVLNRSELTTDPRFNPNTSRVKNRKELDSIIHEVFRGLTRTALIEKLETAQIAYGRVSTLDDVAAHPQNRYIKVGVQSGNEEVVMLGPGAEFVDTKRYRSGAVAIGTIVTIDGDEAVSWSRGRDEANEKPCFTPSPPYPVVVSQQPRRESTMSLSWRDSATENANGRRRSAFSQSTKRDDGCDEGGDGASQSLTSERFGTMHSAATESTASMDGLHLDGNTDSSPSRKSEAAHPGSLQQTDDNQESPSTSSIHPPNVWSQLDGRSFSIRGSQYLVTETDSPNSHTHNSLLLHRGFADFPPALPGPALERPAQTLGDNDRQPQGTIRERGRVQQSSGQDERGPFGTVFRASARTSPSSPMNSSSHTLSLLAPPQLDSRYSTISLPPSGEGGLAYTKRHSVDQAHSLWSPHHRSSIPAPLDFLKSWSDTGPPVMSSGPSRPRRTRSVQSRLSEQGSTVGSLGRHRTESNNDADSVSVRNFSNSSSINNLRVLARSLTGGSNQLSDTERPSSPTMQDPIRRSLSQESFRKSWLSFSSKETAGTALTITSIERSSVIKVDPPAVAACGARQPLWREGLTKEQLANLFLSAREEERQEVIHEIVRTEGDYLADLRLISQQFRKPMEQLKIVTSEVCEAIFSNVEAIRRLHEDLIKAFRKSKTRQGHVVVMFSDTLLEVLPQFCVYVKYFFHYAKGLDTLKSESERSISLRKFLENLLKNTPPSHPDYESTFRLADALRDLVTFVNNNVKWLENQEQLKTLNGLLVEDNGSMMLHKLRVLDKGIVRVTNVEKVELSTGLGLGFNDTGSRFSGLPLYLGYPPQLADFI